MFRRFAPFSPSALLVHSGAAFIVLAGLGGCANKPAPIQPPAPTSGPYVKVVFLGDSLSAGFQNGSLLDSQQPNGFGSLVAAQAKFPLQLPLIAPPGAPAVLQLLSTGFPPVIQQESGITTGRDNITIQPNDLAVPGHTLHDLIYLGPSLTTSPGESTDEEIITDLVLGAPLGDYLSQLGEAVAQKPTTVFLWTGNEDALLADDAGSPSAMTPLSSFTSDYTELITILKTYTSAHLVVANIPDVTMIPYMTPGSLILAELSSYTGLPASELSELIGVQPNDLVNAQGLTDLEAEVAGLAKGGTLHPLPGSDVLTAAEIVTVQNNIAAYNAVIAGLVKAAGGTLVDLHSYFNTLSAGITINGYKATPSFLGGLFGLDGIHPTNTGYALVANQYIAATNAAFGLSTPAVDVSAVAAKDPYFGPNIKPASSKAVRIPTVAAQRASEIIRMGVTPASKGSK
jgi:lysophospholipase L1-like esterase